MDSRAASGAVLVDDGSCDQSWEVLQELGRADVRVRSLRFAVMTRDVDCSVGTDVDSDW